MHIMSAMRENTTETPAAKVIRKCGGIAATAELIDRDRSVVNRWLLPRESGGTDGVIPAQHQQTLLDKNADLKPDDFFNIAA